MPRLPGEESELPPSMRNNYPPAEPGVYLIDYKFVGVKVEDGNGDLKPGYYLSTLTPKEVWERF